MLEAAAEPQAGIMHGSAATRRSCELAQGGAQFNQALEQTETTAHRAACSFADIFQEHLNKRIQEHNDYLDQAQKKFGIDLSRFIVFKA